MAFASEPLWTICQIGARENYAIARALQRKGRLGRLVTDMWADGIIGRVSTRLGERWHQELAQAQVVAPTISALRRALQDQVARKEGWSQIMDRNAWFQRVAAHTVMRAPEEHGIVFAYSYAAERVFAAAKARGWPTVLGQIDPGLSEAQLVADLYKLAGQVHEHIPSAYWESWRRETALADLILVNSEWSRQGLLNEGVAPDKIVVVPLAYESQKVTSPKETSPTFRSERPLRLLFLGQVTLRKGIDIVLDAMALLPDLPLRLDVVGPLQIQIPETATVDERIIFHGAVPRSKAAEFYSAADIFLFPTRSDGFGLTQLEALSAGVPIISSDRCGAVVEDGKNGFVLQNLEPKALADLIAFLLHSPSLVQALSDGATLSDRFSIDRLGSRLMSLSSQYFNVV